MSKINCSEFTHAEESNEQIYKISWCTCFEILGRTKNFLEGKKSHAKNKSQENSLRKEFTWPCLTNLSLSGLTFHLEDCFFPPFLPHFTISLFSFASSSPPSKNKGKKIQTHTQMTFHYFCSYKRKLTKEITPKWCKREQNGKTHGCI